MSHHSPTCFAGQFGAISIRVLFARAVNFNIHGRCLGLIATRSNPEFLPGIHRMHTYQVHSAGIDCKHMDS